MGSKLSIETILNDIELELIQGTIPRDDMGESIQEIRRYHNKLRGDSFDSTQKSVDYKEIANRQFHLNSLLISLHQEMASRIQQLQQELQQAIQFGQRHPAQVREMLDEPIERNPTEHLVSNPGTSRLANSNGSQIDHSVMITDPSVLNSSYTEIETMTTNEFLKIDMDVRHSTVPLLGGILNRLRKAFHSITIFYLKKLSDKQSQTNHLYGDWIRQLHTTNQQQQAQIKQLSTQITELQQQITSQRDKI